MSTQPLVLPEDVVTVPTERLPGEMRRHLDGSPGDVAIYRPHGRSLPKLIRGEAVPLLERFREPTPIELAVIGYCSENGGDPRTTLEEAYPFLRELYLAGLLVAPGAKSSPIESSLQPAERFAGFEVVRCVQVLEDTELFQVRDADGRFAALKRQRPAAPEAIADELQREAVLLAELEGAVAPRLLRSERIGGTWCLFMEWIEGVRVTAAADETRGANDPRRVLELCLAVLDAFVELHARGVVHGDVHPGNVLVDAAGSVRILDFGLAHRVDESGPTRAGVFTYHEPELARAMLDGVRAPDATAASDQYSVAVLLDRMVAGSTYLDFALEHRATLQQIVADAPRPFAERRVEPWPAFEAVLARGLDKEPHRRFESMAELATAVRGLTPRPPRRTDRARDPLREFADEVFDDLRPGGRLFESDVERVPTDSVFHGRAGIAYACYRAACATSDPELFALADIWNTRALAAIEDASAFEDPDLTATFEEYGRTSPFHTRPGVHAVQARIEFGRGSETRTAASIARYLESIAGRIESLDCVFGLPGVLLTTSSLLEMLPSHEGLRAAGSDDADTIERLVEALPEIPSATTFTHLGVAHGWAGVLLAMLRWIESSRTAVPTWLTARLDELARLAHPIGRGVRWSGRIPSHVHDNFHTSGWCNGTAGFVQTFLTAARVSNDDRYLEVARRGAWNVWEDSAPAESLCCGLTGRGYALAEVSRATGDDRWQSRARELAERAATALRGAEAIESASLYRGSLGCALLAVELEHPEQLAMPWCGREWDLNVRV